MLDSQAFCYRVSLRSYRAHNQFLSQIFITNRRMKMGTGLANFTDNKKIFTRFKTAEQCYRESLDYENSDSEKATESMDSAGDALYQVFEWSLKNYLYKRYDELKANGTLTQSEAAKKQGILFKPSYKDSSKKKRPVNTDYLFDEMKAYADPTIDTASFQKILDNRRDVNNAHKHSAEPVDKTKFEESCAEIRSIILKYIDPNAPIQTDSLSQYDSLQKNNYFWKKDPRYSFGLVIEDTSELDDDEKKLIASIPWSIVFDLDSDSIDNGLEKAFVNCMGQQPFFFSPNAPEKTNFDPVARVPYWFMLNGRNDMPETLVSDIRSWNRLHGGKLSRTLQNYHAVFPQKLKLVIINGDEKKIAHLIDALEFCYQDDYSVSLLPNETRYENLLNTYESVISKYPMDIKTFASGLSQYQSLLGLEKQPGEYTVVGKDKEVTVNPDMYTHFEILYSNITQKEEETPKEKFYKGESVISWNGIEKGYAIDRPKQFRYMCEDISDRCKDRPYSILDLKHDPGAGGTTLARQIALHLRKTHPVVMLKHYMSESTAKQVGDLYEQVRMSVVIFAENNITDESDIERLYNELKSASIPNVLVYVRRKDPKEQSNDADLTILNDGEIGNMKNKLDPYLNEESRKQLDMVKFNTQLRYPFFMSLIAFEEDFVGLQEYVEKFLTKCESEDLHRLAEIALIDKYANCLLPINYFPSIYPDEELGIFSDRINESLITIEDNQLKMRHPLIADEVLKYVFADGTTEVRGPAVAERIVNLVINFIESSKSNLNVDYDSRIKILKELLITRNTERINVDDFAPIIIRIQECFDASAEIEISNATGLVFKKLEKTYPDEAHFKAHLARFYTNIERNYEAGVEKAKEALDSAESQNIYDALLYHIYGIAEKKYVEKKLYNEAKKDDIIDEACIEAIKLHLQKASDAFQKSRELNHKKAGYESDIHMCIGVVDFAKKLYDCNIVDLMQNHKDSWIMEYCDRAISLNQKYSSMQTDENDSDAELSKNKLAARINDIWEIENGVQNTINMWEKYLLSAEGKNELITRRFIARAKWKSFENSHNQNELLSVIDHLERNMAKEPENEANVGMWINALRARDTDQPEDLIDQALIKLDALKSTGKNMDALYYYFALTCVKAIENSSVAASKVPYLLKELKDKCRNMQNKYVVYEWIGKGKGINRLFRAPRDKYDNNGRAYYEFIMQHGEYLTGVVKEYRSERSATISSNGMDVFFTPYPTGASKASVLKEDEGRSVRFIAGFSYDGVRALNKSVQLIESEGFHDSVSYEHTETKRINNNDKVRVKVEMLNSAKSYLKVKLVDYHETYGTISADQLPEGRKLKDFNDAQTRNATVIGFNKLMRAYELSLKSDKERLNGWQKELEEFKKNRKY